MNKNFVVTETHTDQDKRMGPVTDIAKEEAFSVLEKYKNQGEKTINQGAVNIEQAANQMSSLLNDTIHETNSSVEKNLKLRARPKNKAAQVVYDAFARPRRKNKEFSKEMSNHFQEMVTKMVDNKELVGGILESNGIVPSQFKDFDTDVKALKLYLEKNQDIDEEVEEQINALLEVHTGFLTKIAENTQALSKKLEEQYQVLHYDELSFKDRMFATSTKLHEGKTEAGKLLLRYTPVAIAAFLIADYATDGEVDLNFTQEEVDVADPVVSEVTEVEVADVSEVSTEVTEVKYELIKGETISADDLNKEFQGYFDGLDANDPLKGKVELVDGLLKDTPHKELIKTGLFAENMGDVVSIQESRGIRSFLRENGLMEIFNNIHTKIQDLKPLDISEYQAGNINSPALDSLRVQTERLKVLAEFIKNNSIAVK